MKKSLLRHAMQAGLALFLCSCTMTASVIPETEQHTSYDEAQNTLLPQIQEHLVRPVRIRAGDHLWETTLLDLGIHIGFLETLEKLWDGSTADIAFVWTVDEERLQIEMDEFMRHLGEQYRLHEEEILFLTETFIPLVREHLESIAGTSRLSTISLQDPIALLSERRKVRSSVKRILAREITLLYPGKDNNEHAFRMHIQDDWFTLEQGTVQFDEDAIAAFLQNRLAPLIDREPQHAILHTTATGGVRRVTLEGEQRHGWRMHARATAAELFKHIEDAQSEPIPIVYETIPAFLQYEQDGKVQQLQLLGQGRSNFARSPSGRDFNIRKGLQDVVHNIVVPPGDTFSFNSFLGAVTLENGWKNALAIFGGERVEPVPGGGLCQVSTTAYRAALQAGLPIVEKSNHSLYVLYYQKYGDGLDAAIYPESKDLRFLNDTGAPIFLQARADGDDAYVDIYGMPDGRSVQLIGPIYHGQTIGYLSPTPDQIQWIQRITDSDGSVRETVITSTYNLPLASEG
ncbi:hypothetical protein COU77_02505 [Candidatus Peregrinibacteria bacterium CG10_big_fil_rev_8_21_14_0_10_49_16]|nr:MAG: hypothetical protein COW95_01025 [Candidatus Peregrinibacteria bacterium CG22_combo_CG10-13_8_21_14_all_49_11]PIR52044.1 MAG: hypothetical protein COU77_02505 [Candidatus Peregrinibacteria bacterium CG10_big_fil_rev_8_21_14_0_10_49_16]